MKIVVLKTAVRRPPIRPVCPWLIDMPYDKVDTTPR
jgi:hypothetical protein